jgi:hypothetical protein
VELHAIKCERQRRLEEGQDLPLELLEGPPVWVLRPLLCV